MKRFVLLIIALTSLHYTAVANVSHKPTIEIPVKYLSEKEGLSNTRINAFYVDEFNRLWIATEDGLNCFDGVSVEQIPVPVNTITKIAGDGRGHIWFKSLYAVWELALDDMSCSCIYSGNVVGLSFSEFLYFATDITVYRYVNGVSQAIFSTESSSIITLSVNSSGALYVALDSDIVVRVEQGKEVARYPFNNVLSIDADCTGSVWLNSRTEGTMRVKEDGSTSVYRFARQGEQDPDNVRSVIYKSHDEYYIGTYAGLYLLNLSDESITRLDYSPAVHGFHSQSVRTLIYDGKGSLAIGTFHSGVHLWKIDEGVFRTVSYSDYSSNAALSPIVSAIVEDARGTIWIGTISSGMQRIGSGDQSEGKSKLILGNKHLENVKSLLYLQDEDCMLIGLFSEGIYRYDFGSYALNKIRLPFYAENITRMAQYNKTTLLANCIEGLFVVDLTTNTAETVVRIPSHQGSIIDFCIDKKEVWIVTKNDVERFNSIDRPEDRVVYAYSDIPNLRPENIFTQALKTRKGTIVFGSNGSGLFKYDKETNAIVHLWGGGGLPSSTINRICESPYDDCLYLATNDGIVWYNLESEQFRIFGMSEGFALGALDDTFVTKDSVIFACGSGGVRIAKEKEMLYRRADYKMYIKSVLMDGNNLTPSSSGPLYKSPFYSDSIVVKGTVKSISFDIYNTRRDPTWMTAYEYCLEGFDHEFRQARSGTVSYTNLEPGKYRFVVRGLVPNLSGELPQRALSLRIKPPFYQSAWFIALMASFALSVILLLAISYARSVRLKMLLEVEMVDKENRQRISDAKTSFMTNVSHEFRTPLTLISSNIDALLSDEKTSQTVRDKLECAYRNTEVLNRMVDEFIDYNRAATGDFEMNRHPVKMSDLLKVIFDLFEQYAKNRNIYFSLCIENDEAVCEVDERWLSRALSNIVVNAFKYTRDYIEMKLSISDGHAVIGIIDNGVGIREENIGRVFERFYREKEANANSHSRGSGIGLSLAKKIAVLHGGDILVSSEPEKKTEFSVIIPVSPKKPERLSVPEGVPVPEDKKSYSSSSTDRISSYVPGGGKILIVEDDSEIRKVIVDAFSDSFRVYSAEDGEQGLRMAEKYQPDLIISDVMMPKLSGIQLCETIKNTLETCHIPIILLTALSDQEDVLKGLETGADDYIPKPFTVSILQAKVVALLRNRQAVRRAFASQFNSEEVFPESSPIDARILRKATVIIEENITNQEFDVLAFAKELGLSRSVLFNKIKSITGLTPNEFITSVKLRHAAAMILAEPNETTAGIAYSCGFNTPSYFIKCFRRFYGTTPLHYRKSKLQNSQ